LDLIFSSEASFISLPQGANLNPGKQTSFTIDINPRVINEPTLKGDLVISYSNLSSSVPIIITKRDYTPLLNKVENVTKVELNLDKEELRFTVNQAMINKTVNKDIVLEGTLTFQNFGGVELTNLSFDLTGNLKEITRLSYSSLESLEPGEEQEIHIWVNEDKNLDKDYIGELKITSKEGLTASFPINIHKKIEEIQVKKNETQVPDVEKEICDDKLDNDKDIKIDCEDEDCQGMVDCQKKTNLIPYIVFFSLVLLTILLIIYFYKKGKNPKELSFEKLLGR